MFLCLSATVAARLTALETDAGFVHQALLEVANRLNVLETGVERGFARMEKRFDRLD